MGVLPDFRFKLDFNVAVGSAHNALVVTDAYYFSQCAVEVAFFHVVLDEHDLSSPLQRQHFFGRERVFGKVAFNPGAENVGLFLDMRQLGFVDLLCLTVVGDQTDVIVFGAGLEIADVS